MNTLSSRFTPINDQYPTCVETRAVLRIYPGELSPLDITRRLGIIPTKQNIVGDERVTRSGARRAISVNGWFLSSEQHVRSLDLRRHLIWLLDLLQSKERELLSLQSIAGLQMVVNCTWYSRSGHGGPTLWPEQMRGLADLNLECSFDIYFLSDEDSAQE